MPGLFSSELIAHETVGAISRPDHGVATTPQLGPSPSVGSAK
jgi:hypothetical protein